MELDAVISIIAILALLISFYCFYLVNDLRKKAALVAAPPADGFTAKPLQLQAYERLVLLAERLAIPNLVSRVNTPGLSAREMQLLLLESIKQEFEYNVSQQVYVTPLAWEAVRNLKEQNMLVINEVGASLPPDASGADLNRRLMDVMVNQKKGELHKVVLEAINFEAKNVVR